MARYKDAVCRICRREGMKLFLKGERCMTEKCSFTRRSFAPGQHGKIRPKLSDYALQLREKQKVRSFYGILEKQFKNYFRKASRTKGITGEVLLQLLERRLDNVVLNLGFATSRAQARQIIRHGHVRVNERKVDLPAYLVKTGDVIKLEGKESFLNIIKQVREATKERTVPVWLDSSETKFEGRVTRLPQRDDISLPVKESLIVELYSK